MSVRRVKAGTTDVSVVIRIVDSSDGTPETAVTSATAGLDLWYRRDGAAAVDLTESDLSALTDAHSDGGMLHIADGWYRVDLPDAACASGVNGVQIGGTVTDMVVLAPYIELNATAADVTHWNGTAVATPDTAGYPKVTIKSGTGTGEVSLSSGIASVNATQINSSSDAATRLALAAAAMIQGAVDNSVLTPTTTQFETDDIAEATEDHFVGRIVLWTSGALLRQQALITAYELSGSNGRFTVSAMTEAPANGDTFIIV